MATFDRYCPKRLAVYSKYYTPGRIERIRNKAKQRNHRGDIYAVFEYKDDIYIKRSGCYVLKDAQEVLKQIQKQEPKGKFIIFTELAALNASIPIAGNLG